jgi:hypothetical protein
MPGRTQPEIGESKIRRSVIDESTVGAVPALMRQSPIDEFNRRSSPEFTCILERLGQIARAFLLP